MSISKKPDGSYVIRYAPGGSSNRVDDAGRKVRVWPRQETLRGVSYREAVRIYKSRLGREARRRPSADHRVTFGKVAADYIDKPNMSEGGRERNRRILCKHVLPFIGDRTIESLGPLDVESYQKRRLADVSASTVNREVVVIRAVLNYGVAKDLVDRNPIRPGSVAKLSPAEADDEEAVGDVLFFERDEWRRFIRAIDDDAAWARHVAKVRNLGPVKIGVAAAEARRYGGGRRPDSAATASYRERLRGVLPVFRALLYTGSRLDEILSLKRGALDLKRGLLTIRQPKTRKYPNGRVKTVPLSDGLREVIASLPPVVSEYLFPRVDGRRHDKREVQRAFDVAKRMSGVREELTPHSLRHTFASWHAMAGTPLHTISRLLGHSDVRMTLRYAHLSPDHLQGAAGVVESVEKSGFPDPSVGREVGRAG
jgi:integrase